MKQSLNPFCIFSAGRSGSHFLKSLLESHPEIFCYGEIFHPKPNSSKEGWMKRNYSMIVQSSIKGWLTRKVSPTASVNNFFDLSCSTIQKGLGKSTVGFLAWYRDVKNYPEIMTLIRKREVKIIHLIRENQLKSFVSRQVALQTKVWMASSKENLVSKSVWLDPKKILPELESRNMAINDFRQQCKGLNCLEITYESLVNNQTEQLTKILNFLGVHVCPLHSDLMKQNPDDLSQLIKNYDEISHVLKGTKFEYVMHS